MKTKLFNSRFEIGLRVLLILGEQKLLSVDQLLAFDFITTYASSFNLEKDNLHGDSAFNYSEIANRRQMINKGISLLRMYSLVDLNCSNQNGYEYSLTDLGNKIEKQLDDQYAIRYRKILSKVINKYYGFSSKELMHLINSNLMKELG